jgi:hypothetical protein
MVDALSLPQRDLVDHGYEVAREMERLDAAGAA